MDREANLPGPPATSQNQSRFSRPFSSSLSSSSSSATPDLVRHVQAALKRHRPLGNMQSESLLPRRILVPKRVPSKGTEKSQVTVSSRPANANCELIDQSDSVVTATGEVPGDSSITPLGLGTVTKNHDQDSKSCCVNGEKTKPNIDPNSQNDDAVSSSCVVSQHLPAVDCAKEVQISLGSNVEYQSANELMVSIGDNLSSHLSSLGLTAMECDGSNRVETFSVNDHDPKPRYFQQPEILDISLRSDARITSLLAKRSASNQDQQHQLMTFIGKDISHPMTQSSVVGSTCATTTLVHSSSAPMLNSTTYSSYHRDSRPHMDVESLEEFKVKPQPIAQGIAIQSCSTFQCNRGVVAEQTAIPTQASSSAVQTSLVVNDHGLLKGQQDLDAKDNEQSHDAHAGHRKSSQFNDKQTKEEHQGNGPDVISQVPLTRDSSTNVKLEPSKSEKSEKSEKPEKAVSGKGASGRKKNYDADMFFKVNGKLYQRLGKIGSGGSSEVYKVISSDCTIYALKRIKLKGRDYSTAYGFCQEIEYLNKLKGKKNIIQLIDYEVTDRTLLEDVMKGSMNAKDGRIKDDGHIYMVLEYGEIDLAHMLSQKGKEMDSSNWSIDENWLRFYWQQILQAVNTIHEERIVHSDLKPANFLLVKGSLKLIDFGIAKAIMSDTTNIQRDSQVGTLSYMSPEAFMCNENDADGNAIKCGRPSDIWSLGCILYQMVYGKTPFAEYKTFWAKFKVITDRNHKITYAPISNLWLLDLMKKCLAWDRSERWRIPQLLLHPFLVPPVPSQSQVPQYQNCKLLQLMAEAYENDSETSGVLSHLQQVLTDPIPLLSSQLSTPRDQHCELLSQISRLCCQLQQHIASHGKE